MQKHLNIYLLIFLLVTITSCKEEICMDNALRVVKAGLYQVYNNVEKDTSFYQLSIQGIGSDSILYDSESDLNQINLPLSPLADTCAFVFVVTTREFEWMYIDTTDGVYDTAFVSSDLDTVHISQHYDTIDKTYTDIVSIIYQRYPDITNDCGVKMNYDLLGVSYLKDNIIDSVVFINPEIIDDELENIKIYY